MDKVKNADHFARVYAHLNETERSEFSRIANKLLSSSFLCAQRDIDRNDYYEALQRISLYRDYFSVLDYEVISYSHEQVIQLKSTEKYNHLNLKLNESVVLLLLRKLYFQKSKEISLHENVILTIEELHDSIAEIGWLQRRMNKTELRGILRLFKRYSLIDNIGEIERDDSMLLIYPSIIHAVPYEEIVEIDKQIKAYGREEENETVDEDTAD